MVFSEDGTIPLQGRYFDRKDRLARTIHWDDVREFDGRRLPLHMTLVPEDDKGYRTEMRYQAIRFDADVTEDTFSLSNLERHR